MKRLYNYVEENIIDDINYKNKRSNIVNYITAISQKKEKLYY